MLFTTAGSITNSVNVNAKHTKISKIRKHHKYYKRKSYWHQGVPKALRHYSEWIGSYVKSKYYPDYSFVRITTSFSNKTGFNSTPFYFNSHKRFKANGTDEGAGVGIKPYYKWIGHNSYKIISGNLGKHALKHDFEGQRSNIPSNINTSSEIIVKIHNKNNINIYENGSHGYIYDGKFHKISQYKLNHLFHIMKK